MKLLLSGSSGFVGQALISHLAERGYEVRRLVRRDNPSAETVIWNPDSGRIEASACEHFDAVIHLGGENIAAGRWTQRRKKRLRNSRVNSTRFLALTLSQLQHPPKVFACASAIGFYGDRGDEILTEQSPAGVGFMAELGQEWESACQPAFDRGIRVVNLRFGIILGKKGGALAKMLTPFRCGIGGKIGNGRQYWSWISLTDAVRAVDYCLNHESVSGPVNLVSPGPPTNYEFTKALGKALRRPTILPLPGFAARLAFGEMADSALLASARVEPEALINNGFEFTHPDLASALAAAI